MPDYVLLSDLSAKIPPQFITQALDDDNDGVADPGIWNVIKKDVHTEIDGALGARYRVPFRNPVPPFVLRVAVVLACAAIYERRGVSEKENPFAEQRKTLRKEMKEIAEGKAPLDPSEQRVQPSVSVVTEPAATTSSSGKLSV